MKLLITGGFGLVGSRLLEIWQDKYETIVIDTQDETAGFKNIIHRQVDILNQGEVNNIVEEVKPDWVLHLAAFTDVERAETERDLAWDLNVNASSYLAEAVKKNGSRLVYISTGFVFDGSKEVGYSEDDKEEPVNYYALTKLEGERAIRKLLPEACILRINFPYRSAWERKSDTIRWMIPKLLSGEEISLVDDQFVSLTFIDDLAPVLDKVFAGKVAGVYHVSTQECLSFFEIGKKLAKEFGVDENLVKPTKLDSLLLKLGKKAVQPRRSCLITTKVEQELGVKMTTIDQGLKKVKESYS